jgi:hypothetical protein
MEFSINSFFEEYEYDRNNIFYSSYNFNYEGLLLCDLDYTYVKKNISLLNNKYYSDSSNINKNNNNIISSSSNNNDNSNSILISKNINNNNNINDNNDENNKNYNNKIYNNNNNNNNNNNINNNKNNNTDESFNITTTNETSATNNSNENFITNNSKPWPRLINEFSIGDRVDALDYKNNWYGGSILDVFFVNENDILDPKSKNVLKQHVYNNNNNNDNSNNNKKNNEKNTNEKTFRNSIRTTFIGNNSINSYALKTKNKLNKKGVYVRIHFDNFNSIWDEWYNQYDLDNGF